MRRRRDRVRSVEAISLTTRIVGLAGCSKGKKWVPCNSRAWLRGGETSPI